jgi:hypothetical protein
MDMTNTKTFHPSTETFVAISTHELGTQKFGYAETREEALRQADASEVFGPVQSSEVWVRTEKTKTCRTRLGISTEQVYVREA